MSLLRNRSLRLLARSAVVAVLIASCSSERHVTIQPTPTTVRTHVVNEMHVRAQARVAAEQRAAVDTLNKAKVLYAVRDQQVAAAKAAAARAAASSSSSSTVSTTNNHAGHSDAWWHGVAICEQGGRNDDYFGYFSYMDGSAGGGMSWADQVAKGNRTIATYGDHAWAASCVAAGYRASPGG